MLPGSVVNVVPKTRSGGARGGAPCRGCGRRAGSLALGPRHWPAIRVRQSRAARRVSGLSVLCDTNRDANVDQSREALTEQLLFVRSKKRGKVKGLACRCGRWLIQCANGTVRAVAERNPWLGDGDIAIVGHGGSGDVYTKNSWAVLRRSWDLGVHITETDTCASAPAADGVRTAFIGHGPDVLLGEGSSRAFDETPAELIHRTRIIRRSTNSRTKFPILCFSTSKTRRRCPR